MNIPRLLLLLFMLVAVDLRAHIVYHDQPPYESPERLDSIYRQCLLIQDSLASPHWQPGWLEIVEIDNRPYMLPVGRLNVFEYSDGRWQEISNSIYHGYNFCSKKFVYAKTIYSFGGYGFWRWHGDLIWFDRHTRMEWEARTLAPGVDIGHGISFVHNGALYVILHTLWNQTAGTREVESSIAEVNLSYGQIIRHKANYEENFLLVGRCMSMESDNFLIDFNSPILMIRKSDMTYKVAGQRYMHEIYQATSSSFIVLKNDSLFLRLDTLVQEPVVYDLAAHFDEMEGVMMPLILPAGASYGWWQAIAAIAGLGFGLILYFKRRKRRTAALPGGAYSPMISKLLEHDGQDLKQNSLDTIFEIGHIKNINSLKTQRAEYFNRINAEYKTKLGKDLITRMPDPEDRRQNLYQIRR